MTRNDKGFTLIAVMIALVVLSAGLITLARTQTALAAAKTNSADQQAAVAIARTYMEDLRSRDPWSLTSEAAVQVNRDGARVEGGGFHRSTAVTVDQGNLLTVQVNVTSNRIPTPVVMSTLVYRGTH